MKAWGLVRAMVVAMVLVACGTGPGGRDATSPDGRIDILVGDNQTLPSGMVGEPYEAQLVASGGEPPYTFDVAEGFAPPAGLWLRPSGELSGTPYEAGTKVFQVIASDRSGQDQRFLVTIDIGLTTELLSCGETKSGFFTQSGFLGGGPDWTAVTEGNLQWIDIPWPQGDNTRVEIKVDADQSVAVMVQRPNQPLGSLDWREDYVTTFISPPGEVGVTIDAGTLPSLSNYAAQGRIPLVVAALGAGPYTLEIECSDGPIFRNELPFPVRRGEDFVIDYDVYGDNGTITFDIVGELPEWVEVDETTGTLSGTALEEVTVDLQLTATSTDGRTRTATSIFGVFDPKPIACGEAVPFTLEQGYNEGEVASYFDPRGYEVFLFDVPTDISAVQWTLEGLDGQYLGLVRHDEDQFLFFPNGDRDFTSTTPATLAVDPRTYAAIKHYQAAGEMYVIAAPTADGRDMVLTATCDEGPRPNLAGLPLVQPLTAIDAPLRGVGGTSPYTFSASGLPSGLSVEDGRLVGSSNQVGTYPVDLTVTDANGTSFTDRYDLYLGLDEACDGGERIACGDTIQGSFDDTYSIDGAQSTGRFCFFDEGVAAVGFEFSSIDAEFRVDVGDPGVRGSTFLAEERFTYASLVLTDDTEAVPLNAFSWPALTDYAGLPVHMAVRSFDPGDWSVSVVCDPASP